MVRVAVVGGGIAGLAAAYRLKKSGVPFVLLEASSRLGGKIVTEKVRGFSIECGPDSFLTLKPQAVQLAREVGLGSRLLPSAETQDVYIYARGALRKLPEGLFLMAPSKAGPFLASDLFSWPGKARVALDLVLPRGAAGKDESLAQFARRRLGREAVDLLVEPIMAGIFAGDAERLSAASTFPQFVELERRHRSLILGLRRQPAREKTPGITAFMTLRGGLAELTTALAKTVWDETRLDFQVRRVESAGKGFRVAGERDAIEVDAVILTPMAWQAAPMLRGLDADLACTLEEIPFSSSSTLSLAYEKPLRLPPGFGFVAQRSSDLSICAATFSSSKFPGRAPQGATLIRCFFKRDTAQEEAVAAATTDLEKAAGVTARPDVVRHFNWPRANPQYTVGHAERLRRIDERLARHPGLLLAGASYRGVGLPDCVASGFEAARCAAGLIV